MMLTDCNHSLIFGASSKPRYQNGFSRERYSKEKFKTVRSEVVVQEIGLIRLWHLADYLIMPRLQNRAIMMLEENILGGWKWIYWQHAVEVCAGLLQLLDWRKQAPFFSERRATWSIGAALYGEGGRFSEGTSLQRLFREARLSKAQLCSEDQMVTDRIARSDPWSPNTSKLAMWNLQGAG